MNPGLKGSNLAGWAMSDVVEPLMSLDFIISTMESKIVRTCIGPEMRQIFFFCSLCLKIFFPLLEPMPVGLTIVVELV